MTFQKFSFKSEHFGMVPSYGQICRPNPANGCKMRDGLVSKTGVWDGCGMKDFVGKTAVVTGAASGIGLALAERFAAAGMNLVLGDIEQDPLRAAVQRVRERQVEAIGVPVDTMLRESVAALAQRAFAAFGKVHVLCNNAGVASTSAAGAAVWEVPNTDWDWVLGVNFHGVLYGLQTFVPHMLDHGEPGHIVNTASLAGLLPGGGSYGVSKHGVLALTETLHSDLKARGSAIGCSVLCPGFVNTRIFAAERNRPPALAAGGALRSETAEMARSLLERGKPPAEVAEIVIQSIEENRFYILPHPAWDDILRARLDHVLGRDGPAAVDLAAVVSGAVRGDGY